MGDSSKFWQMKRYILFLVLLPVSIVACYRTNQTNPPNNPPGNPQETGIDSAIVMNDYDAVYHHDTIPFYGFAYHVKQILYYRKGRKYFGEIYLYNASDTFHESYGDLDTEVAQKNGCFALVSNIDSSQQGNYNYFIGSYYKFSLFSDTAVGNVQFMFPVNGFISLDSIHLDSMYYFRGGINGFYTGMANSEVKVLPDFSDFVRIGDNFSYANSQIPAIGLIDSAEASLYVTRFSDNGIHPNSNITKTIDANYSLNFYFHNGRFSLINGKFTNLFFQKKPM